MNDAILSATIDQETKASLVGMSKALDMSISELVRGILSGSFPGLPELHKQLSDQQRDIYQYYYDKYLKGVQI